MKVPLVVTPIEVKQLQQIQKRRLAKEPYKAAKTAFFANIRARYKIQSQSLMKIETDNPLRLGVTQWRNNKPVMVEEIYCQR